MAHIAMDCFPECSSGKRGRLTKTWRKTFKEDLAEMEINRNDAKNNYEGSFHWRKLVA